MKPTEQQLQDIYEEAVSAECAEKRGEEMSAFDLLCKLDEAGGLATFIRTMIDTVRAKQQPELTVFYKSMPESNGKENWTAILHRKGEGIQDGMTIDRSEYPERVLYAADRVRYLIGEKAERPHILDYDADKRSDYVPPQKESVTYPQNLPCPVRLEPGLLFGKGVTTSTMLSALQRRAEYYAELEAMTPEEREKHDASIEEFKAMLPQGDMPLSVRANGEANSYTLLKDGSWFANILMNGEMTVPQHWDFLNSIAKNQ